MNKEKKMKGFTLIELIVVMAILALLVLLAAPKFLGQIKEATFAKHITNAKILEDASERYYIDYGKWPRGLDEEVYTAEEVTAYADKIYDITGKELTLEEGNYWDIDYDALSAYAKLPDKNERANYILRNPVGKVYYLEGITNERKASQSETKPKPPKDEGTKPAQPDKPIQPTEWIRPDYYEDATDEEFSGTSNGNFRYVGSKEFVVIPAVIKGVSVTSYANMFQDTGVKGVASGNTNVTNMDYMFASQTSANLDVSGLNTSGVKTMQGMFQRSQAESLDLRGFDTAQVTSMGSMFQNAKARTVDLTSFNTATVAVMSYMFSGSAMLELPLGHFDTRKVTTMTDMFSNSKATHIDLSGFDLRLVTHKDNMFRNAALTGNQLVRTQFDADILNKSSNLPTGLTFGPKAP